MDWAPLEIIEITKDTMRAGGFAHFVAAFRCKDDTRFLEATVRQLLGVSVAATLIRKVVGAPFPGESDFCLVPRESL